MAIARGHGPLRAQIEAALRDGARSGRLRPGGVLPSSRVLARDLGTSRGVVVGAYEQLTAEGFLISRPRRQTVVAPRAIRAEPRVPVAAPEVLRFDFRPGVPDGNEFPRREWSRAARQVLRSADASDLGYGDVKGFPRWLRLREAFVLPVLATASLQIVDSYRRPLPPLDGFRLVCFHGDRVEIVAPLDLLRRRQLSGRKGSTSLSRSKDLSFRIPG